MTFWNKASNVIQCGYSEITLEINQLPGKGPIFAKKLQKSAEMRDKNWAIWDDLLRTLILKCELGTSKNSNFTELYSLEDRGLSIQRRQLFQLYEPGQHANVELQLRFSSNWKRDAHLVWKQDLVGRNNRKCSANHFRKPVWHVLQNFSIRVPLREKTEREHVCDRNAVRGMPGWARQPVFKKQAQRQVFWLRN